MKASCRAAAPSWPAPPCRRRPAPLHRRDASLNAPAHAAASVALEVLELLGIEHRAHAVHDGMHHALARRLDSHPTPISLAGPAWWAARALARPIFQQATIRRRR